MCKGWSGETDGLHCWEGKGPKDESGSLLSGMGVEELIESGGRQGDLLYAPSRPTPLQIGVCANRHLEYFLSFCV